MLREDISKLRQNYDRATLEEQNALGDPIEQFDKWFGQAADAEIFEHNAMILATSLNDVPDARVVLLKSFDHKGFVFFTNYESAKGKSLDSNPKAALVFLWKELERQVRIRGDVLKVDKAISEAYFNSRPIDSRCGAIASDQSSPVETRAALNQKFLDVKNQFENDAPTMPAHWGGYIVEPIEIEFWQGREGRMHDRLLYKKNQAVWDVIRLQP